MLGTNDLLQSATAEVAAVRMENFLAPLLPHCKNILLVSPPPMKRSAWVPTDELVEESIRLAEEYRAVANRLNVQFIDTTSWSIDLTYDGVHFTEKGHHTFAINIAREIKKSFHHFHIMVPEQLK